MNGIFRIMLVVNLGLYLAWFIFPYSYKYWVSEESLQLLSYSGFEAFFIAPESTYWVMFAITACNLVGLFFYVNVCRSLFLVLLIVNLISQMTAGLTIYTGVESGILNVSLIFDGVLLAMMYLTTVSLSFKKI